MSFDDLNQFLSFYFAEVIIFKREQTGIEIAVAIAGFCREREKERERERENKRYTLSLL